MQSNISYEEQGATPVRALAQNIVAWLENLSPGVRKKLTALAGSVIERDFDYGVGAPLKSPWIESINGGLPVLKIPEGFCAFTWMVSFALLAVYDAMIAAQHNLPEHTKLKTIGDRAFQLLTYALDTNEQNKCYPNWSRSTLPQPETPSDDDKDYVEKANAIYVSALSFILCHEMAHAHFGHLRENERHPKDIEREADNFAAECFTTAMNDNPEKARTLQVGIVGTFLTIAIVAGLSDSETHPSALERLDIALNNISLQSDAPIWNVASAALLLIDFINHKTTHGIDPTQNPQDIYNAILQQMRKEYISPAEKSTSLDFVSEPTPAYLTRITHNPGVMGGKPCIRGLRITVGAVIGLLAAGKSIADILALYPLLEPEDIKEALAYSAWRVEEPDAQIGAQ